MYIIIVHLVPFIHKIYFLQIHQLSKTFHNPNLAWSLAKLSLIPNTDATNMAFKHSCQARNLEVVWKLMVETKLCISAYKCRVFYYPKIEILPIILATKYTIFSIYLLLNYLNLLVHTSVKDELNYWLYPLKSMINWRSPCLIFPIFYSLKFSLTFIASSLGFYFMQLLSYNKGPLKLVYKILCSQILHLVVNFICFQLENHILFLQKKNLKAIFQYFNLWLVLPGWIIVFRYI